MFKLVTLACLAVVVLAAPQAPLEPIAIISGESSVNADGSFQYSFETADGTKAQQAGQLKDIEGGEPGNSVQGSFSFTGADGQVYSVTYTADENGYQPQGDHIPGIPEAIQRSLEYNAAHPEQETGQQ